MHSFNHPIAVRITLGVQTTTGAIRVRVRDRVELSRKCFPCLLIDQDRGRMGGMTEDSEPMPAIQESAVAMVPSLISSIANTARYNCVAAPSYGIPLSDICNTAKRSLSSSRNEGVEEKENLDENRGLELSVAPSSVCATNDDWKKNAAAMRRPLCRLSRKRKSELHRSLDEGKKGNEIITIDPETSKLNEGKERLAPPPKRKTENKTLHTVTQTEEDELIREIILALPPYELVRWGTSRQQLLPPLPYQKGETPTRVPKPTDIDDPSKLTLVLDLDETLVSKP